MRGLLQQRPFSSGSGQDGPALIKPVRPAGRRRPGAAGIIMTGTILVLAVYLIYPIVILFVLSFNTSRDVLVGPSHWGISNWVNAWKVPGLLASLGNSFLIWFLVAGISLPIAIAISLVLARTNIPFSHAIEAGFWIAFIFPPLASTFGWIMLAEPTYGFLNKLLDLLPFIHGSPLNIYSVPGIVWTRLMGAGIAFKVILLTPAFRNMDGALEEASRTSGASRIKTLLRVTLPVMATPIVLVLALQLITVFQGFETEYLLGSEFNFYVYSTKIYQLVSLSDIPQYAQAIVLASVTLLIIAVIIPIQRWITTRRPYTTVTSSFKPSLIDLGRWKWPSFGLVAFILFALTALPALVLVLGSFMERVGFFNTTPLWTTIHWQNVLTNPMFTSALLTTIVLSVVAGVVSPVVFSLLAYMIVRTRWRGRTVLDSIIWASAAMPGILLGLGLLLMFLITPGLKWLFGTIWVLMIVIIAAGTTTGVNVLKGVFVQLGASLEEAGRVAGAGWIRTYFKVVVPVLMPSMVLVGMLSFVAAANTTSSIILLASQNTQTLATLALTIGSPAQGQLEQAGILSLIILVLSLGVALPMRTLARRLGVRHDLGIDLSEQVHA
jgi:iron(III) transport system permease protein